MLYEELDGNVGLITLNAPDKLNALGADMGDEFLEIVEHLRTEASGVNAVVLTGAGKAFSAGGDLNFLMQRHNDTPSRNTCVRLRHAGVCMCVCVCVRACVCVRVSASITHAHRHRRRLAVS